MNELIVQRFSFLALFVYTQLSYHLWNQFTFHFVATRSHKNVHANELFFLLFSQCFRLTSAQWINWWISIKFQSIVHLWSNRITIFFCSNILILRNGTKWFIFDPILTEWREHNLIQENYHFSIDAKYICKLKFQFNCLWHCRSLDLCTSQTMRKCTNRLAMSNMNFYQLKRQLDSLRSSFSSKYISS